MHTPQVSLLVAMRNERQYIERSLKSLLVQDYPQDDLEVYILDGYSTDKSWEHVQKMISGKNNFKLVKNQNIYQSSAWNLGIRLSKGDIVGIISAHTEIAPDYVAQAVDTLKRTNAAMVGGPTCTIGENYMANTIGIALSTPFGVGGGRFHYTTIEEEVDTVFMGLCRREVYEKIGGFDEEMIRNQDDELSYRLRSHGGRIICNPAIKSKYYNRATLSSLWKQYYQYGYWKVRVLQKHPRQMRPRQFVPPLFVASLLLAIILTLIHTLGSYPLALILALYLLADLSASILTASRKGWKHLHLLLLVYPVLHLSYGLGFLVGLVKFAHRWGDKVGQVPNWVDEID